MRMNKQIKKELAVAIQENDLDKVKAICDLGPLSTFFAGRSSHWLSYAIENSVDVSVLEMLVKGGVDPQVQPKCSIPFFEATRLGRPEYVDFLFRVGADPYHEVERPILQAVNERHPARIQIEMLELFIKNGVDLNHCFTWFGDTSKLFTVLEHTTSSQVKEFLRSQGAKTAGELSS